MLQIAPGFSKDKTKRLDNLKKFWKWNKTKAFGQTILRTDRKRFVSIQNFDLKSLHSIFFGTKAAKWKLPILKIVDLTLLVPTKICKTAVSPFFHR
jgi:hypothetical protein